MLTFPRDPVETECVTQGCQVTRSPAAQAARGRQVQQPDGARGVGAYAHWGSGTSWEQADGMSRWQDLTAPSPAALPPFSPPTRLAWRDIPRYRHQPCGHTLEISWVPFQTATRQRLKWCLWVFSAYESYVYTMQESVSVQ